MKAIEKKIVILAPLRKIEKTAKDIVKKMNLGIDVTYVNENNVIEIAKEKVKNGKEIIISRGGIANTIRNNLVVSVIDIEITAFDILKILSKKEYKNKKIAVVEIPHITNSAIRISNSLNLNTKIYRINKIKEFASAFNIAISDGAEVIISGSWAMQFENRYNAIKEKGIIYEVIESGEEAIIEALYNAKNLYKMTALERKKKEEFKAVLNFVDKGIISVDKNGIVQSINPVAVDILSEDENKILNRRLKNSCFQKNTLEALKTDKNIIGRMTKINDKEIVFNCIPIVIDEDNDGVVISFQEIEKLQELEHKVRRELTDKGFIAKTFFSDIIGNSIKIKKTINFAKNYSKADSTILITGESGCGKELFAQSIHNFSRRKNNPFIAVNCAALPSNLLESELFGYVEGAFTGARKNGKMGLFELAHTGTIFLDEIGEIDKKLQTRLLRVIQEKEIMRIGDDKIIPINVRIITATNKDLLEEVDLGNFREDLYYRLNVLNIYIPPLRERKDDIELLMMNYVDYLCKKYNYKKILIDNDIVNILLKYDWPGNVRELQNIVERILVLKQSSFLTDKELAQFVENNLYKNNNSKKESTLKIDYSQSLDNIEMQIIKKVLEEENYNKSKTSKRLGINRTTLNRKLE